MLSFLTFLFSVFLSIAVIFGLHFTRLNHLYNLAWSLGFFFLAGNFYLYLFRKYRVLSLRNLNKPLVITLFTPYIVIFISDLFHGTCNLPFGTADYFLNTGIGIVFFLLLILTINKHIRHRYSYLVLNLYLLFSIILTALPFFIWPQSFAFNHIAGFIPGPVYDRFYTIGTNFLLFRLETLLICLLLIELIKYKPGKIFLLTFFIIIFELVSSYTGILNSASSIKEGLGSETQYRGLHIYRSTEILKNAKLDRIMSEIQYRYNELLQDFELNGSMQLHVYLFKNEKQKMDLIGAKTTEIAKPWQKSIFIDFENSSPCLIKHEMLHVFLGKFSDNLLNIPFQGIVPSMGIVEGMAEVFTDCPYHLNAHKLSKVMLELHKLPNLNSALNPTGFWKLSAAESYSATTSFFMYLRMRFGTQKLLELYQNPDFFEVFQTDFASLIANWKKFLRYGIKIGHLEKKFLKEFVSRKSIFRETCPQESARLIERIDSMLESGFTNSAGKLILKLSEISLNNPNLIPITVKYLLLRNKFSLLHEYVDKKLKNNNLSITQTIILQLAKASVFIENINRNKANSIYKNLLATIPFNLKKYHIALLKLCLNSCDIKFNRKLHHFLIKGRPTSFLNKPILNKPIKNKQCQKCVDLLNAQVLFEKGNYSQSNDYLYKYQDHIKIPIIEEWINIMTGMNNFYLKNYYLAEYFFVYVLKKTNDSMIKALMQDKIKRINWFK